MGSPVTKQSRAKQAGLVDSPIKAPSARKPAAPAKVQLTSSVNIPTDRIGRSTPAVTEGKRSSVLGASFRGVFMTPGGTKNRDFRSLYLSSPEDRIKIIREGVGATETKAFAVDLGIPQDRFFRMFGIAQATVTRRASRRQPMSPEESEKIVGMAKLVGQVQTILDESGDRELMKDFDAAKWLANWMEDPLPALGGKRPAEYMDTIEGQEMVSRLLMMMQTGAYA